MANGTNVTDGVLKEIDRQIADLPKDDPIRLLLIIGSANYYEINRLKNNMFIKFCQLCEDLGKGLTVFVVIVIWILTVLLPNIVFRLITMIAGIDIGNFIK